MECVYNLFKVLIGLLYVCMYVCICVFVRFCLAHKLQLSMLNDEKESHLV